MLSQRSRAGLRNSAPSALGPFTWKRHGESALAFSDNAAVTGLVDFAQRLRAGLHNVAPSALGGFTASFMTMSPGGAALRYNPLTSRFTQRCPEY
jgi:hypothetical protein